MPPYCTLLPHSFRVDDAGTATVSYRVLGVQQVAVPTHFFKVLLIEDAHQVPPDELRRYRMLAFLLPNGATQVTRGDLHNRTRSTQQSTTLQLPSESSAPSSGAVLPARKDHNEVKSEVWAGARNTRDGQGDIVRPGRAPRQARFDTLMQYLVPVDAIEFAAGFLVFDHFKPFLK